MGRGGVGQGFGASAETAGYRVYPPLDGRLQAAGNRAVRVGLIEYDRRHGWRGPAGHVELPAHGEPDYEDLVEEEGGIGNLPAAIVIAVSEKSVRAYVKTVGPVQIDWDGLAWAHRQLRNETVGPAPRDATEVVSRGDVIYVVADSAGHAQLAQVPEAQSALVALQPNDGAIRARAARPPPRARHAGGDAARCRARLRGLRQRRLPRRALLHRPHRGSRRPGGVARRAAHGVHALRCGHDIDPRRGSGAQGRGSGARGAGGPPRHR